MRQFFIEKGGMRLTFLSVDSGGLHTHWNDAPTEIGRASSLGVDCMSAERADHIAAIVGGVVAIYENNFMGSPTRIQ